MVNKFREAWLSPVFSNILNSPAERITLAGFGVLSGGVAHGRAARLGVPVQGHFWDSPVPAAG